MMQTQATIKTNHNASKDKTVLKLLLYIAGEAILLLFFGLIVRFSMPELRFVWLIDGLADLTILGSAAIMLLIVGLFPDFLRSFTCGLKKQEQMTAVQIKRSLLSLKLVMVTAVAAQMFLVAVEFVNFMAELAVFDGDVRMYATAVLANLGALFIHSIVVALILLPVWARMKVMEASVAAEQ